MMKRTLHFTVNNSEVSPCYTEASRSATSNMQLVDFHANGLQLLCNSYPLAGQGKPPAQTHTMMATPPNRTAPTPSNRSRCTLPAISLAVRGVSKRHRCQLMLPPSGGLGKSMHSMSAADCS